MNSKQKEIMLIAQEECAEVVQAISKCFRFGFNDVYNGATNKEKLEEEVGDLLCMINMMMDNRIIDRLSVEFAIDAKSEKIRKWSNIFKNEETLTA
jgi:NTP pyrophosphatase (non-canonical NTP hydrolase)